MIINKLELRIATNNGSYGFSVPFSRNLTIVRGNNSSGKSTLFNSLLYSLGMEEIVGGRNEKTLPYAVKDYFEFEGERLDVISSEVLIEIQNHKGESATLRRKIRDKSVDSKLIEVFHSKHLTSQEPLGKGTPKYLHDPGSAQLQEGFFTFLESFLGLHLPTVSTTNGGETKLYLQAVFASLAVEQKRGWTDYIANIPYFAIRDARTRVVEFLLGMDVFELTSKRNRLSKEHAALQAEWGNICFEITQIASAHGLLVSGIPKLPAPLLKADDIFLFRRTDGHDVYIDEALVKLRQEHQDIQSLLTADQANYSDENLKEISDITDTIQRLSVIHERAISFLSVLRSSDREYRNLLAETKEDIERNKAALKLKDLGASLEIDVASDRCPTCGQGISKSLIGSLNGSPLMDISENVAYLSSQAKMLDKQISGISEEIVRSEENLKNIEAELTAKQAYLKSLRGDISSGSIQNKARLRRQIQIESEIDSLSRIPSLIEDLIKKLQGIARSYADIEAQKKKIPKESYSDRDLLKLDLFQKMFRANAGSFGYASAPIPEIEISTNNLVPTLSKLELREIRADIKSDSSASDFVRLIWSYLIGLYQASSHESVRGNHLGILLLDEPGQHSMAVDSQHALLRMLSDEKELQCIVAASFDESESVFRQAIAGIPHDLVSWDGRLIRPLQE